jgi:hypothetical protein
LEYQDFKVDKVLKVLKDHKAQLLDFKADKVFKDLPLYHQIKLQHLV